MFFLVRKSVLGSLDELQDLDFDVKELLIGSSDSNNVILESLEDGILSIKALDSSNAQFSCTDELKISLGEKSAKSGKLKQGVIYQLGVYDLEVIKPPSGFDFAINVIHSKRKSKVKKQQFVLETKKSPISIRTISYLAFIAIISLFLIVPYFGFQNPSIKEKLDQLPIPTDRAWSSGPLAMAHRIPEIGDNCNVCHVKPFEKVQDKQCLSCHQNLGEHVANNHPAVAELDQFLCENCHKEHNEPLQLTRTDDALCIDCHSNIENFSKNDSNDEITVRAVNGFNSENHPPFRLSMVEPVFENGLYDWKDSRPMFDPGNPLKEQSNLKFSHQVHLDEEKGTK